uniref:Ribonuclease A M1 n=1 Tax=Ochotona princeps TaxID=9978 RepID=W0UV81_OCHPR|nr:TPA: ribonuclease A M1 [Ochotona princeps]
MYPIPTKASYPKFWIVFLLLLCLQCWLLTHSKATSWKKFKEWHYLSPRRDFISYKCDDLMELQETLEEEKPHIFIYASWYQIEHLCVKGIWNDRYRNTNIWTQHTLKVLKCKKEKSENFYRENRGYNHIKFHCNMDGHVDRIENFTEPITH